MSLKQKEMELFFKNKQLYSNGEYFKVQKGNFGETQVSFIVNRGNEELELVFRKAVVSYSKELEVGLLIGGDPISCRVYLVIESDTVVDDNLVDKVESIEEFQSEVTVKALMGFPLIGFFEENGIK